MFCFRSAAVVGKFSELTDQVEHVLGAFGDAGGVDGDPGSPVDAGLQSEIVSTQCLELLCQRFGALGGGVPTGDKKSIVGVEAFDVLLDPSGVIAAEDEVEIDTRRHQLPDTDSREVMHGGSPGRGYAATSGASDSSSVDAVSCSSAT